MMDDIAYRLRGYVGGPHRFGKKYTVSRQGRRVMASISERLREVCADWNGDPMADHEIARRPMVCAELREAAESIDKLTTLVRDYQDDCHDRWCDGGEHCEECTDCTAALAAAKGDE